MADSLTIPRRLSVRDDDFDFEIGKRLVIYLDGVKQDKVIAYDIDAGTLLRFATDAQGRAVINRSDDRALEEALSGVVTVEWRTGQGRGADQKLEAR